ncbi:MAG: class I SAM-dependent methyltransferase [Chloroflexota bacterium]
MQPLSDAIWNILTCSFCGKKLEKTADGAHCPGCGLEYSCTQSGSLDLRLQKQKKYPVDFELGTPLLPEQGFQFDPLQSNPHPELDLSKTQIPRHLSKEIISYFPKAASAGSLMLDLGCGNGVHRELGRQAGFEWVGLDYEAPQAPILGDAQALPFEEDSFDFILCLTVLQYVRNPFVAMREAYRVLKPGGKFIGTVAFLEPSHGTSFYHHTHLGIYNSLNQAGFTVHRVAPQETWPVLKALASMGLFFRMPRALAQAIVYPLQLFHQLWWRVGSLISGRNLENIRIRHFTGSHTFIAGKPKE